MCWRSRIKGTWGHHRSAGDDRWRVHAAEPAGIDAAPDWHAAVLRAAGFAADECGRSAGAGCAGLGGSIGEHSGAGHAGSGSDAERGSADGRAGRDADGSKSGHERGEERAHDGADLFEH